MDHSFVMFFSDGGASPIYGTEITLYNMVRNSLRSCKGSCIYSFCYDVGIGSNPNFLSTCNAIGATYFSSTSPWLIAAHLQFWSWIRIFWTPCPCWNDQPHHHHYLKINMQSIINFYKYYLLTLFTSDELKLASLKMSFKISK